MVADPELQTKIEPLLLEVADVVNTTLDLDTTLRRVAELVRKVIDYEIFAILLLNEKTQELRFRFQVGYSREVAERIRIKVGEGVTGIAAQRREPILVARCLPGSALHFRHPQRAFRAGRSAHRQEPADRGHRPRVAVSQPLHGRAQTAADADRLAHGGGHRKRAPLHPHHAPGAHAGFAQRDRPRAHVDSECG